MAASQCDAAIVGDSGGAWGPKATVACAKWHQPGIPVPGSGCRESAPVASDKAETGRASLWGSDPHGGLEGSTGQPAPQPKPRGRGPAGDHGLAARAVTMRFQLERILSPEQLQTLRSELLEAASPWQAGIETAGWHARAVKHNRQLARDSDLHRQLAPEVLQALAAHPLLQAAALPLRLHSLRFSRCGPGEGYGRHLDDAYMAEGRSDLSFTLFLSEPEQYDGGDLVLEFPSGEERHKLAAGDAVVYPSTLLHRVEPVARGERLVAVGWIESRIRSAEQRELLFELDTARRSLFAREGKSDEFDLISRSYSNLLRLWGP